MNLVSNAGIKALALSLKQNSSLKLLDLSMQ